MTFTTPVSFIAANSLISTREGDTTSIRTLFMGAEPGWVDLPHPEAPQLMNQRIENNRITGAFFAGKKLMRTVRFANGEEITGTDNLLVLTVVIPDSEFETPTMVLKELQDITPDEDIIVYSPWKDEKGRMSFQASMCVGNTPKGPQDAYALVCETPENNSFVVNKMIVSIPLPAQDESTTN